MNSDFVSADRLMRALSNGEFEPYHPTEMRLLLFGVNAFSR